MADIVGHIEPAIVLDKFFADNSLRRCVRRDTPPGHPAAGGAHEG